MTKKNSLLDRIDVREPCTESWEQMTGNNEVRFCSHCSKNVYDLSSYTRQRAEKLVRDSNGGLCVRYRKDERGRVITAPPKFTQIKRHAKIAAGVLATTLSVASMAYSQCEPISLKSRTESAKGDKNREPHTLPGFVVSGFVQDVTGASVGGAEVILLGVDPKYSRQETRTNAEGFYSFRYVNEGEYKLEVTSPGFKKAVVIGLNVAADTRTKVVLEVGEATVGLLIVEGEPLVCEDPPKVSNDIRLQEIQALPPGGKTFTLGLIPGVAERPEDTKPVKKSKKKVA